MEHVSTEEPPRFVKNTLADSGTAAEAWAEPFWYSRAARRGLSAVGTTREVPDTLTLGRPWQALCSMLPQVW